MVLILFTFGLGLTVDCLSLSGFFIGDGFLFVSFLFGEIFLMLLFLISEVFSYFFVVVFTFDFYLWVEYLSDYFIGDCYLLFVILLFGGGDLREYLLQGDFLTDLLRDLLLFYLWNLLGDLL